MEPIYLKKNSSLFYSEAQTDKKNRQFGADLIYLDKK